MYILLVAALFPLSGVVSRVLLPSLRRAPELFDIAFASEGFRAVMATSNLLADHSRDAMTSSHYAHAYHRALRHPVHLAIQQCRHQVGVSDIGALSPQSAVRQARRAFVSEQKRYGLCCPIPWLPHGILTAVATVGLAAVARRYCVVGISDDWSKNLAFVFSHRCSSYAPQSSRRPSQHF